MTFSYEYPRPALSADCVVFGSRDGELHVVLVQRDRAPFAGSWALPGGFLDEGEELADAARRELREETGIAVGELEQVGAFGAVGRDPRGRVISVAYWGLVDMAAQQPVAADDARNAAWFAVAALPPLAFDHADILQAALRCHARRPEGPATARAGQEAGVRALILVDLQYDFMPGGALAVADGDATVPVANRLMPRFDLVVATQDFHPRDHGSFVTQHAGRRVGDQIQLHGLAQTVWPEHCVQGTRGAELHAALNTAAIARVFPKGTDPTIDSYSGFFDNGKRKATGLGEYLRAQGVTEVCVMGLATDYCVKSTALDAAALGFRTRVVVDGCRAVNLQPGDGERALREMRAAGIEQLTADELCA